MSHLGSLLIAALSCQVLAACSPEQRAMTVEEFMKPENAAALETALETCKFTLPGDTRPTNCRAANTAKFALDTRATSRTRRGYAE